MCSGVARREGGSGEAVAPTVNANPSTKDQHHETQFTPKGKHRLPRPQPRGLR